MNVISSGGRRSIENQLRAGFTVSVSIDNTNFNFQTQSWAPLSFKDALFYLYDDVNEVLNSRITVSGELPYGKPTVFWADPQDATLTSEGKIESLKENKAIDIFGGWGAVMKSVVFDLYAPHLQLPISYTEWATNSLARSLELFTDTLITGREGVVYQQVNATHQNLFSSGEPNYIRNPNHLLSAFNLTGISAPKNYSSEGWTGGTCATVISPRHILGANHYHLEIGRSHYFVTQNNEIVTRQLINGVQIANTDIWIGYLDSPLPTTIKPFKVLPSNWKDYLPNHFDLENDIPSISNYAKMDSPVSLAFPAFLVFNSTGDIHIGAYQQWETSDNFSEYTREDYKKWWKGGFYGSGSIVFTLINNDAVTLFCLRTPLYSGPPIHRYITEVNTAMATLHGSNEYQLTTIDLSGFPTY